MGSKMSSAADKPAPTLPPSSAQDCDELATRSFSASPKGPASSVAGTSSTANESNACEDQTGNQQLSKLWGRKQSDHRSANPASGCREGKVASATTSAEPAVPLERFALKSELQDPVLSARRYFIVEELGEGSYGKVMLAWDERRQYAKFLFT